MNASLYLMQQPGYTSFNVDTDPAFTIGKDVAKGAKYLFVTTPATLNDTRMHALYGHPMGRYKNTHVFDLRELDREFQTAMFFDENIGNGIPFHHRNNAHPCSDGYSWCYGPELYPQHEVGTQYSTTDPKGGSSL